MKSKIKVNDQYLGSLPAEMQDGLEEVLKENETEELILKRNPTAEDFTLDKDDERMAVNYASTRTQDRDNEIVVPNGVVLSQFRKAPVLLWGHNWRETPIGSDKKITSDGFGLLAKSQFATTPKAEEIFTLVREKHLRTSSIGFIPLSVVRNGTEKFGPLVDKLSAQWDGFTRQIADKVRGIITRSLLLEHSLVSVPANIDSLVLAVSNKSIEITAATLEEFGVEVQIEEDIDILKELPDNEGEEDADDTVLEKEEKKPTKPLLVARLIKAPEQQVKIYSKSELAEMVKEAMELSRGRI